MRLSDTVLKNLILENRDHYPYDGLSITPKPKVEDITGVTVDLRLGTTFRRFLPKEFISKPLELASVSLSDDVSEIMDPNVIELEPGSSIVIQPGELLLGITAESVKIPTSLVGWLDGRSSLARVGLQVHATAHRIDPGWDGKIVLEFINAGPAPLQLTVGMKIGALSFETIGNYLQIDEHTRSNNLTSGFVDVGYVSKTDSKYLNQSTVLTAKS